MPSKSIQMSRFELLQILAHYSGPQNPKHDCKGIPVAPHMAGCLGDQREYSFLEKELGPTNCHSHPLTLVRYFQEVLVRRECRERLSEYPRELNHHRGCCCSEFLCWQIISRHDIDHVWYVPFSHEDEFKPPMSSLCLESTEKANKCLCFLI